VSAIPSHAPPGYICPSCAVVGGKDNPPYTVQEDVVDRTEATTAWICPRWWKRNAGHVLVVPNEHVENIYGLRRELAADVHDTARRIAFALRDPYGCGGVSTRQHNEPAGYQEVWHYHLHVIPRYDGDDLYRSPGATRRPTSAGRMP
jgi:histidine triad (HIT) family protein